jgi:hypothetical protein
MEKKGQYINQRMILEFLERMKKEHPADYDIIKELENKVRNFR